MDSPNRQRRRPQSLWLQYSCCVAIPLLFALSYVTPTMRYLKAQDNANYLEGAFINSFGSTTQHAVGKVVSSFVEHHLITAATTSATSTIHYFKPTATKSGLEFCETNIDSSFAATTRTTRTRTTMTSNDHHDSSSDPITVCVVLSAYEHEDALEDVMESILSNRNNNNNNRNDNNNIHIQIVAVDNGSTDGSRDSLLNYSKKQSNVQLIHLAQHVAEGQAYNIGIQSCPSSATYILLNDGLTTLESDTIPTMVSTAEHHQADIVLADFDTSTHADTATAATAAMKKKTTNLRTSIESDINNHHHDDYWTHLPTTTAPFTVYSHPNVTRIDPLVSRKLMRRRTSTSIEFPEGHYESAHDTFHFATLTHATRIAKIDRVLFHHHHRQVTTDQGSFFSNAHQVGKMIFGQQQQQTKDCLPPLASTGIAAQYYNWIDDHAVSNNVDQQQVSSPMQDKLKRLWKQTKYHWPQRTVFPQSYWDDLSDATNQQLRQWPAQIDLTIIMPTYNVQDLLDDLLVDMFATLQRVGTSFEVFAIDDGSTDGTLAVLTDFQEEHANLHVLKTVGGGGGAGRARNVAIPLIEGRYVYFVDADDGYDFATLAESVSFATDNQYDLLIFPYETQNIGPKTKTGGMMSADLKVWEQLLPSNNRTHEQQQEAAYGLINYPWKQLTSSRIMKDDGVFFGPTKVHNDVQFHWTSIAASTNIHFYHQRVCSHRFFDASVRGQLTSVKSSARMSVFDSLSLTQRALARQGAFDEGGYAYKKWVKFSRDVLNWASKRVPEEMEKDYKVRWKAHLSKLLDGDVEPSTLRHWAYWERPAAVVVTKQ